MRLTGWKSEGTSVVDAAIVRDDGSLALLGALHDFWCDPLAAIAREPHRVLPAGKGTLVPLVPRTARVFCVGVNYLEHVREGSLRDVPLPAEPTIFGRWPSTLCTDGTIVRVPYGEPGLDWEGEVAAVVARPLSEASADEARDAILGYAAFNDLTARVAQKRTSQWTIGKNADNSGPISSFVTADEVGDLRDGIGLRTRVNGVLVQEGDTSDMIHDVGEVLAYLSRALTVQPGDVVCTGTPSGVGYARTPPWFLTDGDEVEVEVDRVGSVAVRVARREGGEE